MTKPTAAANAAGLPTRLTDTDKACIAAVKALAPRDKEDALAVLRLLVSHNQRAHDPASTSADTCTLDWGDIRLPPFRPGDDFQPAWSLYEALRTLRAVACGLLCQPRFFHGHRESHNAAGKCLESLQQAIACAADQIADAARDSRGAPVSDDYQAMTLLQNAAMTLEGLDEIAELARRMREQ